MFMPAGTADGSRSYVATGRITGRTDDGREGSVTVRHGGLESDSGSWFGHIVPGTGTGGFAGWTGSARSSTMIRAPTSRSTWRERPGSAR